MSRQGTNRQGFAVPHRAVLVAVGIAFVCGAAVAEARPKQSSPRAERSPLAKRPLYVAETHAVRQARSWRGRRPGDAAIMRRIASQPQAAWFGDWNDPIRSDVAWVAGKARRERRLPVFVAYAIPGRDCGLHSAGGMGGAAHYRAWIRGFAAGIGRSMPAAVIVEPDALAMLGCLSRAGQRERLRMIRYAVRVLRARTRAAIYLDAGHSAWQHASVMARRLRAAGVRGARGFSLNISNFRRNGETIAYGHRISRRIGGKPFVIDTSRNGAGPHPDGDWCNPRGRALGRSPTASTNVRGLDAFLWIKRPGESDGPCNGGPRSGEWWPEYALELARNAGW